MGAIVPGGWKKLLNKKSFWILVAMLVGLALLHYLTPQARLLPLYAYPLARHSVERILFTLPIAGATFAFGRRGGLVTLVLSLLIMAPRALFVSPSPVDASMETIAVGVVGYLVVWMIDVQEKEKRLRQEAVSRLQTINAITAIVTSSLELEQVMDSVLGKVLEVTQAQAGCVYLLDRETHELFLALCRGAASGSTHQAGDTQVGEMLTRWVMEFGDPLLIRDLWQSSKFDTPRSFGTDLRSLIAVPLKSRDKTLGFIYLADAVPDRFADQDLQLLTAISSEIGVAIENAWLHHDVARQLRIEQRLNEVAERITTELELDKILPKVLQIAGELVNADGGGVALLDVEKHIIHYPYLNNLPAKLTQMTRPQGSGLAGEVMATGKPVVMKDYASYAGAIPAFVGAGVTSVVMVPIASGDLMFGALVLSTLGRSKDFTDRDVAILVGLGRQAGIAIENAYLYENMRYYVQQITRAQEDERKRIARELHDDTIQSMIVLSRQLDALAVCEAPMPHCAIKHASELRELTDQVIQRVRRFSQDLRPSILDDLGLVPALADLTTHLTQEDGIHASLEVVGEKRRLSPESELSLFRIAQESLTNTKKHARASSVLTTIEFRANVVRITIEDDGQGFKAPAHTSELVASGKLGLTGMYERARLLGGTLTVASERGQGTTVTAEIPA